MIKTKILLSGGLLTILVLSANTGHGSEFTEQNLKSDTATNTAQYQHIRTDAEELLMNSLEKIINPTKISNGYIITNEDNKSWYTTNYNYYIANKIKEYTTSGFYDVVSHILQNEKLNNFFDKSIIFNAVHYKKKEIMTLIVNSCSDADGRQVYIDHALSSAILSKDLECVKYILDEENCLTIKPSDREIISAFKESTSIIVGAYHKSYSNEISNYLKDYMRTHNIGNEDYIKDREENGIYNPFSSQNPSYLPGRPGFSLDSFIGKVETNDSGSIQPLQTEAERGANFIGAHNSNEEMQDLRTDDLPAALKAIKPPFSLTVKELLSYTLNQNDTKYMDTKGYLFQIIHYDNLASQLRGIKNKLWLEEALLPYSKTYNAAPESEEDCLSINGKSVQFIYKLNKTKNNIEKIIDLVLSPLSNDATKNWLDEQRSMDYSPRVHYHV